MNSCEYCPAGSYKVERGSGCELCPVGYYSASDRNSCEKCDASKPMSVEGSTSNDCKQKCPDNEELKIRIPKFPSSAVCTECGPGFERLGLNITCNICPAGTYRSNEQKCETCISNDANKPLSNSGAKSSSECKELCKNAGYGLNADGICDRCPAGQYESRTGSGCQKCKPGTYKKAGETLCKICPPATPLSLAGATDESQCKKVCDSDGQGLDLTDSSSCRNCPPGFQKSRKGNGCSKCEAGTYESGGSCTKCPSGTPLSLEGSTRQSECNICSVAGEGLKADVNGTICSICEAGSFKVNNGSGCQKCPAGTYGSGGTSTCTECTPGSLSLEGSKLQSDCRTCPNDC